MAYYDSPRWSQEIYDCSMPMTFDTYSKCSYGCLYCFSAYQRDLGLAKVAYHGEVKGVSVERVKKIFTDPDSSQFGDYVRRRFPMQWGGLSDQFDEFERRRGTTLELLRFFREIEYPICFSTKAAWWTEDERYMECFKGATNFNVKFSIITLDAYAASIVEAGCPTPKERVKAMKRVADAGCGGVTLRLRPYIIGLSDKTARELIRRSSDAGATAMSTEFFCLEQRSVSGKELRYPKLSSVVGFDIVAYYRQRSSGSGYLRLNRDTKRPHVDMMEATAKERGMRFYVSDAHFKERCANGSCCGLPEDWGYTRGQDCEALMIAKAKGEVAWSDIASDLEYAKGFEWARARGYNCTSTERRSAFDGFTMYDYLRYCWNHPKQSGQSPYRMFEGVLMPSRLDSNGDVVYVWNGEVA